MVEIAAGAAGKQVAGSVGTEHAAFGVGTVEAKVGSRLYALKNSGRTGVGGFVLSFVAVSFCLK